MFFGGKERREQQGTCWTARERPCVRKEDKGLGLRRLHNSNIAMVTKQAWRIITRQDSLVDKVFKAKYFPTSSLLEAQLGTNPSYIWRSVWGSLNLLREGARWRVRRLGGESKDMKGPMATVPNKPLHSNTNIRRHGGW